MASFPATRKLEHVSSSPLGRVLQHGDVPFKIVIALSSLTLLALMLGVGVMLWLRSEPTRAQAGWSFITRTTWNPVGEVFGALPFIVGLGFWFVKPEYINLLFTDPTGTKFLTYAVISETIGILIIRKLANPRF